MVCLEVQVCPPSAMSQGSQPGTLSTKVKSKVILFVIVYIITARSPKGEGTVFTSVCSHPGGVPTLDGCTHPGWGYLPWTGVPALDGGGAPKLDNRGCTYLGWKVPTLYRGIPTLDMGTCPRWGSTYLGHLGTLSIIRLDGGNPSPLGDREAERVLGAFRAVCLLRSCRRTFLLDQVLFRILFEEIFILSKLK